MWNRFKTFDPWLFLIPFLLMSVSIAVIYTLTIDSVGSGLVVRQAESAVLGFVLIFLAGLFDYRSLKGWSVWVYLLGIVGLIVVMIIGKNDFGAQRWIELGFFQLQPGEVEKLIIIISLAVVFSRVGQRMLSWARFLQAVLLLLVPLVLIVAEPDLGTAIVVGCVGVGMLLHTHLSRGQTLTITVALLAIITVFTLSFREVKPFSSLLKEYQKDRLASFVEPSRDPNGTGYNVVQSVIAVGSGGLTGRGLGFGSQSQLNFLPVAHADFIFAGIAEAWGLAGSLCILGLYGWLLQRILLAARIAKDDFGMLLCIGIAIKIAVEMLVNVGMNIRLMPVTGIPLPFLSYGGTTMLTNALCLGLVQSVVMRYKRLTF